MEHGYRDFHGFHAFRYRSPWVFCFFGIDQNKVIKKVDSLIKSMGITKTKLGEILGKETDDPRVKIARASRFLSGAKKNVTLCEINALANFFQKPAVWFLFDGYDDSFTLQTSEKHLLSPSLELEKIRKNLKKMGFDEDFIHNQIKQLKAMEAYKANQT